MARAKRGHTVWQCSGCGYWSERKQNVIRHNQSRHGGAAPIVQAYATLVVEPSYQIVPISPLQALPFQTPPPYVTAQDTTSTAKNQRITAPSQSNASSIELEKPIDHMEASISFFQKFSRFIEEDIKARRLIQQAAGIGFGTGFYGSPPSVPMQTATIPSTRQPVSNRIGYAAAICNKCLNSIVSPISDTESPVTFRQRIADLPHNCKGELSLASSSGTEAHESVSQAVAIMENALFKSVKESLQEKEIVLEAKKLDYTPQHPYLVSANATQEMRRLVSDVIKFGGRVPFNDETLRIFLRWGYSSIVIVGISGDKEGSAQEYYSLSIQGQDKQNPTTKIPATTTSITNAISSTDIAANNDDHRRAAMMKAHIESLRQVGRRDLQAMYDDAMRENLNTGNE